MMFALLAALLTPSALADNGPYMWGVGPSLGTIVYPGRFPAPFSKVENAAGEKATLTLDKVKGDIDVGARGALYLDKYNRLGAHAGLGFGGGGYRAAEFTAGYDFVALDKSQIGTFIGVGGGFGTMRFDTEDVGRLHFSTYLLRAQLGALYRDKVRAYEVDFFGQLALTGPKEFENYASDLTEEATGGFYGHFGLEATCYFGDLTPPSRKKK